MSRKKTKNFLPPTMGDDTDEALELDVMGDDWSSAEEQAMHQVMGIFRPNEEFDRARETANSELIQLVAQYLTDYPTQRFGQALNNLGLLDNAPNVEPQDQLKRAKKILRRMNR